MKTKRIASNVSEELHAAATQSAKELGISCSNLLETALKNHLRNANIYKENKRLIAARNKVEQETEDLRKQLSALKTTTEETASELKIANAKLDLSSAKLTALLERNWWQRFWNILPWSEQ